MGSLSYCKRIPSGEWKKEKGGYKSRKACEPSRSYSRERRLTYFCEGYFTQPEHVQSDDSAIQDRDCCLDMSSGWSAQSGVWKATFIELLMPPKSSRIPMTRLIGLDLGKVFFPLLFFDVMSSPENLGNNQPSGPELRSGPFKQATVSGVCHYCRAY